jgi:hypothetical protein
MDRERKVQTQEAVLRKPAKARLLRILVAQHGCRIVDPRPGKATAEIMVSGYLGVYHPEDLLAELRGLRDWRDLREAQTEVRP